MDFECILSAHRLRHTQRLKLEPGGLVRRNARDEPPQLLPGRAVHVAFECTEDEMANHLVMVPLGSVGVRDALVTERARELVKWSL